MELPRLPFASAIDRLQPRERLLVGILGGVLLAFFVFIALHLVSSSLDDIQEENEGHSEVLREIGRNRATFRETERQMRDVERRYATKAPPLQSFLEEKATSRGIEIRDAQDRPDVQHGKKFVERSVQIRLNKVDIRSFVDLMEDVSTSRHPMAVTKLRVRKRLAEPNAFDVEMTVSAFDRVGAPIATPGRPGRLQRTERTEKKEPGS